MFAFYLFLISFWTTPYQTTIPSGEHNYTSNKLTPAYLIENRSQEDIKFEVDKRVHERSPIINGAIIGIIFFIAVYNLGFYFAIKDKSFLWYVCFQFFTGLTWLYGCGYVMDFFLPKHPEWENLYKDLLTFAMSLSFILFSLTFLRIKYYLPVMEKYISRILLVSFSSTALLSILFKTTYPFSQSIKILGVMYLLLIMTLAFHVLKKGFSSAKYFLLAQFFFIIGALARVFTLMGILPINDITVSGIEYGSIIEALIFSVGLRNRHRIRQEETSKKTISEYKHRAFSAQINSHFIFNSLCCVQELIINKSQENALSYLSRFAKLVRLVLENSHKNYVYLSDELKMIRTYIEMEQLCCSNKFDYSIHVDERIDPEEIRIPSLLIQPFIENSIIHGFVKKDRIGHIQIRFEPKGANFIRCVVEDNGIGRSLAILKGTNQIHERKTSLGIDLVTQRIKLLGTAKGSAPVEITDLLYDDLKPKGTKVIINIPIQLCAN